MRCGIRNRLICKTERWIVSTSSFCMARPREVWQGQENGLLIGLERRAIGKMLKLDLAIVCTIAARLTGYIQV